jgi:flagellar biosynthesis regulator FlbT
LGGFIGGVIGGGIVALSVVGYSYLTNDFSSQLTGLEQALSTKVEQSDAEKFDLRLTSLETGLAETKAVLAANAKKLAPVDPLIIKRFEDIEAAVKSLSAREPIAAVTRDHKALRLALILLLRDDIKTDQPTLSAISALESFGEIHPAFTALKDNLTSRLPSYAALVDEEMSQMKSGHEKSDLKTDDTITPSRFPSFLSQLITVRPAKTTEPAPVESNDIIEPVITALEDQRADEALKLISALPENARAKFKALESDIARRANVENAIATILEDALNAISKGDKP